MKTAVRIEKAGTISRNCAVCGREIEILINKDKTYEGNHYFGRLSIGKNKKVEYWECNPCFNK